MVVLYSSHQILFDLEVGWTHAMQGSFFSLQVFCVFLSLLFPIFNSIWKTHGYCAHCSNTSLIVAVNRGKISSLGSAAALTTFAAALPLELSV